jgi:hypothetical protein
MDRHNVPPIFEMLIGSQEFSQVPVRSECGKVEEAAMKSK